jgi:tripartite-type tricarboxylate transporter receptor subunit TctC
MKRFVLVISLFLFVFGLSLGTSTVSAQRYPNRPITFVVPGGLMLDTSCRVFSEEISRILKIQCPVVAKPGGSLTIGTDYVVRSKKDGYTILYTATAPLIVPKILRPKSISYDWEKDLEPLGGRALFPFTVVVREDSPWKTFGEFIDYAKKHPGEIRVGTPGIETISNFDLEIIKSQTGTEFTHVPIESGPAIALLGGHIEAAIIPITETVSYIQAGKLRLLLVSNKLPDFPNAPTMKELGHKQDILLTWFGLYGPSGIPEEARKVLVPAVEKAVKTPEVKARIEKLHFLCDYISPADMKKQIMEEYQTVSAVAAKLGLSK